MNTGTRQLWCELHGMPRKSPTPHIGCMLGLNTLLVIEAEDGIARHATGSIFKEGKDATPFRGPDFACTLWLDDVDAGSAVGIGALMLKAPEYAHGRALNRWHFARGHGGVVLTCVPLPVCRPPLVFTRSRASWLMTVANYKLSGQCHRTIG